MHKMRRMDKAITDVNAIKAIIREAKFITIAISVSDEPYLSTLSHGFDEEKNCIYFHCASEGRKVEMLKANGRVWGQALIDGGYQQGCCDHFYRTAQFHGIVSFVDDALEKRHALEVLIKHLDDNPEAVISKQITPHSLNRVLIGRIDIDFLSGKKADKVNIQL